MKIKMGIEWTHRRGRRVRREGRGRKEESLTQSNKDTKFRKDGTEVQVGGE